MPLESVLFLNLVIAALSVFTATLIYGQWATRNVVRDSTSAAAESSKVSKKPAIVHSRSAARAYEEAF
jgi:hypothetical protein